MFQRLAALCCLLVPVLCDAQTGAAPQTATVVTVSPACPEYIGNPGLQQLPPIHITYDPAAPGAALHAPQSLTLHMAVVGLSNRNRVQDIAMTHGGDGVWSAVFTSSPYHDFPGYFVFDFEDGQHHIDRNGGDYWDVMACYRGKPADFVAGTRAQTYLGREIVPGMRRRPDIPRAIAYLRRDYEENPLNDNDLFWIWSDELLSDGDSPATFALIGRELEDEVAKKPGDSQLFFQTVGFVGPYVLNLPAASIAAYRAAALALPEKADHVGRMDWRTGSFPQTRKTEAWKKRFATEIHDAILAELDFNLIAGEADPKARMDRYLVFAKEYSNSRSTAGAYIEAFNAAAALKDIGAAETVFQAWSAWDPKNPDPLAEMAKFYIDSRIKLDRAIDLLNRALALFTASNPGKTRLSSDKTIKAQESALIAPFSSFSGKIEFLRGQAYLLLNDLPQARADLETAVADMPDKPDVQYAAGEVREKMGDDKAALDVYLAAASAPYNSSQAARDAYERLFLAMRLGSVKTADDKLFAYIKANETKLAADYQPVPLDRPASQFLFHEIDGKLFTSRTTVGKPTVIDFWTVWCGACTVELPALQQFQHLHPEVYLLTVAIDPNTKEVRSFLSKKGLRKLHVAVVSEVPEDLTTAAYPTTIVLDRAGRLQFVHDGVLPDVAGYLGKDLAALSHSD